MFRRDNMLEKPKPAGIPISNMKLDFCYILYLERCPCASDE